MKTFIIVDITTGDRVAGTQDYADHLDAFLVLSYFKDSHLFTVMDITEFAAPKFWDNGLWVAL